MAPVYPSPWGLLPKVFLSDLLGRKRSFRADIRPLVECILPPMQVSGAEHLPQNGPGLIVCNHYYRPGYDAWWTTFAISANLPVEAHWIMSAERRYEGLKRGVIMRPLEKVFIRSVARVYGFFPMPAIPPLPQEAQARAAVVRRVVDYVWHTANPLLALAPEGQDDRSGKLGWPPPGGGRFMLHLNRVGLPFYPAGVYESEGHLFLRFGPSFNLDNLAGLGKEEQDLHCSRQVMQAIANLLPEEMRSPSFA